VSDDEGLKQQKCPRGLRNVRILAGFVQDGQSVRQRGRQRICILSMRDPFSSFSPADQHSIQGGIAPFGPRVSSFVQRAVHTRPLLDGDRPYAEVSNKRAVMRENDSRSGGGLEEMTRRNLEITGLQTNRTSRVWSNSRFPPVGFGRAARKFL
jgi:hypothetical protein